MIVSLVLQLLETGRKLWEKKPYPNSTLTAIVQKETPLKLEALNNNWTK